jgi:hypothetical protein
MKKKIKKLTPAMLKKIIAEEKQKLNNKKIQKRKVKSKTTALTEVKALELIKAKQRKLINEIKRLFIIRKKIKNKLINRL